jgi:hypothetical protein
MLRFDDDMCSGIRDYSRESFDEILHEKNRLISLQERDMESLKREITSLKKQLSSSNRKKK